jgi:hypothetical protein
MMMNATSKIRSNIHAHKKTFSMMADIEQKRVNYKQTHKVSNNKWVIISGFSRFASRTDLDICLGDFKPLSIDPLLDAHLYPTGKWAIQLGNGDSFHRLKQSLNNPESKDIKVLQEDSVTILDESAFKHNICNRTVRFRNVHKDIGPDEISFFLQDFDLEKSAYPIRSIENQSDPQKRSSHYLVNFATSEEAERVVFEKSFAMFEGIPVQLFWYHC